MIASFNQNGALLQNDDMRLRLAPTTDRGSDLQTVLQTGRCFVDNAHRENQRVLVNVRGGDRVRMTTRIERPDGQG